MAHASPTAPIKRALPTSTSSISPRRTEQRVTTSRRCRRAVARLVSRWQKDRLSKERWHDLSLSTSPAAKSSEAIKATYEPSKPSWSANGKAISVAALRAVHEAVPRRHQRHRNRRPRHRQSHAHRTRALQIHQHARHRRPHLFARRLAMAFVMDGYLWVRPVDANGIPTGEARPINEEMTDAPSWSGDGKRLLYLSNGKLRIVASDGSAPPQTIPVDLTWQREVASQTYSSFTPGVFWDGLGPRRTRRRRHDRRRPPHPKNRAASRRAASAASKSSMHRI